VEACRERCREWCSLRGLRSHRRCSCRGRGGACRCDARHADPPRRCRTSPSNPHQPPDFYAPPISRRLPGRMGKSDSATTRNDGGIDPAALAVASLAAAVSIIAPPGPYGPASMMIGATILVVIFAYDVAPRRTLSQSIAFGGVCALISSLALGYLSNTPSPPIKRKDSVYCSRSCRKARTSVTPRSGLGSFSRCG
jgi:hypothetical protein